MDQFTKILTDATKSVPSDYFQLAIADADPIYRERVYCYELYHQMRLRWPSQSPYRLNGEVDKSGHPAFKLGRHPQPDFLVHQPGSRRENYAVIEVKPPRPRDNAIEKDLDTLELFTGKVGYRRGIYLLYGGLDEITLERIHRRLADTGGNVEIWLHDQSGTPAYRPAEPNGRRREL